MIVCADVFIMWGLSLLYLLWRTKSLQVSITTTSSTVSMVIAGVFLKFADVPHEVSTNTFIHLACGVVLINLSALVWRVIPHDTIDTWSKNNV